MPHRCTVCAHPEVLDINRSLTGRTESIRAISQRTRLSRAALTRHHALHLTRTLLVEASLAEMIRGDDLQGQVRHLQERTLAILQEAESTGSLRLALAAITTARANLELLARLSGEIGQGSTTVNVHNNVAILQTQEWLDLRERLLRALAPFPEARIAAAAALTEPIDADAS